MASAAQAEDRTKQWIMLLKDIDRVLSHVPGAKDTSIVSLPHPGTGRSARFMIMNGALLELNAIKTELPRSWFIDQSVQQDSTLYVGTPVDPLFLVLPLLTTARDKFTDLAQLLASRTDRPHLRYLSKCNIDPTPICDINDRFAPEAMLYRLNEAKLMAWLTIKFKRLCTVVASRTHAAPPSGTAMSASFSIGSSPTTVASTGAGGGAGAGAGAPSSSLSSKKAAATAEAARISAAQLMGEYLSPSWLSKLAAHLGIKPAALTAAAKKSKKQGGGGSASAQTAAAAWNQAGKQDTERFLKRSEPDEFGGEDDSANSKPTKIARRSAANKRLAKLNTKGMKSLASFFGGGGSKKGKSSAASKRSKKSA